MRPLFPIFLLAAPLFGQPTVAPTNEPVGIARGENAAGYNVRQSFELGYRFHTIGGDESTYRSTVNFGNGIRLLGSNLSIQSLDGHGKGFDQIQLNTQGLGNDPYQNASLRVEKNRLYRYDLNWRSSAYYNPGLQADHAQHLLDTVRNYQDQDLTIFPQSSLKFFLGYSRNTQTGPALTSAQLPDTRSDQYALFANVRRQQNEYRAGFEVKLRGWRLNVLHGWVNFKDDSGIFLNTPSQGYNPDDLTSLASLQRTEPYHGNSPYWRVVLFKDGRWWAFNGRFTYVNGQRAFIQDETAFATDRFGGNASQQVFTAGSARRPAATGSTTFSIFPVNSLTITNQTAISNIRTEGSAVYTQLVNGAPIRPFVPFEYLGIRTISSSTDIDYRPAKWLGVRLGYQYSTRRIGSIQAVNVTGPVPADEQDNALHTGRLGVRIRPAKGLTLNLDGEIARASHPFYPISGRNIHAFRGRAEYKRGAVRFAGYARTDYNLNNDTLSSFASHSRQYGADATWTMSRGFFIDASYAKIHLDTLGTLNYFSRDGNTPINVTTDGLTTSATCIRRTSRPTSSSGGSTCRWAPVTSAMSVMAERRHKAQQATRPCPSSLTLKRSPCALHLPRARSPCASRTNSVGTSDTSITATRRSSL
ncbi:MAG: hypothetical protein WDO18_00615 [Acidobacteriota bacterium]